MNSLYTLSIILVIGLVAICLGLILYALRYALIRSSYTKAQQKRIFYYALGGIVLWLIFLSAASFLGFFANFSTFPPRLALALFLPLPFVLYFSFSKTFRKLSQGIPAAWVVYLQSFRFVVEIILWLGFIINLVPIQMTFEGRNFDILVGITAPIMAYFCLVREQWSLRVLWWWNVGGLALLINIVTVAILSAPTPMRMFMNEPANVIVAQWPFIYIPGIFVPIAYSMHIFSFRHIAFAKEHKNQVSS